MKTEDDSTLDFLIGEAISPSTLKQDLNPKVLLYFKQRN